MLRREYTKSTGVSGELWSSCVSRCSTKTDAKNGQKETTGEMGYDYMFCFHSFLVLSTLHRPTIMFIIYTSTYALYHDDDVSTHVRFVSAILK